MPSPLPQLPPVALGSELARSAQDAIQRELARRTWADEADDIMAEYVVVMLANHKTPAQINAELADLIGPSEYSDDFPEWLWNEVARIDAAKNGEGSGADAAKLAGGAEEATEETVRRSSSDDASRRVRGAGGDEGEGRGQGRKRSGSSSRRSPPPPPPVSRDEPAGESRRSANPRAGRRSASPDAARRGGRGMEAAPAYRTTPRGGDRREEDRWTRHDRWGDRPDWQGRAWGRPADSGWGAVERYRRSPPELLDRPPHLRGNRARPQPARAENLARPGGGHAAMDDPSLGPAQPTSYTMADDAVASPDIDSHEAGAAMDEDAQPPPPAPRAMRIMGVGKTSLFERSLGQAQTQPRATSPPTGPASKRSKKELLLPSKPPPRQPKQMQRDQAAAASAANPLSIFARAGVPDPRAPTFVPGSNGASGNRPIGSGTLTAATGFASISSLLSRIDPMVPDNPIPSPTTSTTSGAPADGGEVAAASSPLVDVSSFPSRPAQTSLCRYGTRCSDPLCAFSHPSIAAVSLARKTRDEPLVLRPEACAFQERCSRAECEWSHVSPAVGFLKAKLAKRASDVVGAVVSPQPSTVASTATTTTPPCRFQSACTNASCAFLHYDEATGQVLPPPALQRMAQTQGNGTTAAMRAAAASVGSGETDEVEEDVEVTLTNDAATMGDGMVRNGTHDGKGTSTSGGTSLSERIDRPLEAGAADRGPAMPNGGGARGGAAVPCRFGVACRRADCYFSHPPARRVDSTTTTATATMEASSDAPPSATPCRFGQACKRADCRFSHAARGKASHISERLAQFSAAGQGSDGEADVVERILPGGGGTAPGGTESGTTAAMAVVAREAGEEDDMEVPL